MDKSLIIKRIKECNNFTTDAELASFLGISRSTLSNWYTRNSLDYQLMFSKCEHVNANWLLTGEGEMLKSDVIKEKNIEKEANPSDNGPIIMQIPLVPVYAYAGYLSGFGDQETIANLPTIPMVATHQGKGNYIAIEVRGDSMDDESPSAILPHDTIVCREINPIYWQGDAPIHYKRWNAFLIVHKEDGIIVKQITAHNTDSKVITVHSLNPTYPDQDIELNDVHQLFNVIQIIRNVY